jgi:hypothetical protein
MPSRQVSGKARLAGFTPLRRTTWRQTINGNGTDKGRPWQSNVSMCAQSVFCGKGVKVKLDISTFQAGYLHNGYELERIFSLQAGYCSRSERAVVKALSKVLHVLFKHPYKEKKEWQWVYHPEVNNIRFGFLKGLAG